MSERGLLSKRNQRGMWVLVIVIFLIIITPRLLKTIIPTDPWLISEVQLSEEMDAMNSNIQRTKEQKSKSKKSKFHRPPCVFDPNQYSAKDWMQLGLSEKQAAVVLKFSKRGIRSNNDLKQVFVISDELFELIKDSTFYPSAEFKQDYKNKSDSKSSYKIISVELNKSTEDELIQLKGVGPYFARKIIEYRDKLGGFHSKEQLLEVWNFDQEKLSVIENSITIDLETIKKININTATVDELKAHPYISWNCANSIVKMRAKHQKYSNFEQLLESVLIDTELLKKIRPYLTL